MTTQPIEVAERTSDPDLLLRLAADFRLDRLNASVASRVLSNPAAPSDAQALCRDDRDVIVLGGCTFAAGASVDLADGEPVVLVFGQEDVYFVADEDDLVLSIPVDAVTGLEISGPGHQIRGGGFYRGAGIGSLLGGAQGALDGALLATVLNGLSREETVTSFIRVSGLEWEGIFIDRQREPEQLRRLLSPAFVRVKQAASAAQAAQTATEHQDLASRLERLASLLDRGLLTREDYEVAKLRVLVGE